MVDKWFGQYKVRAFLWIDEERIYFNVQYYGSGQSVHQSPIWDKTVYVEDSIYGRRLVEEYTHTLVERVARMHIEEDTEVNIIVEGPKM